MSHESPHWCVRGDGRKIEIRVVPGLYGYLVTEDGEVFSRLRANGEFGKRLSPRADRDGYLYVEVSANGGRKNMRIHRMVALAFLGEQPADAPEVRHKDGNPANNHWQNLAWSSHVRNMADRAEHGRNPRGSRNGRALLTEDQVRVVKARLASGDARSLIANDLGVKQHVVDDIASGKNWSHVA